VELLFASGLLSVASYWFYGIFRKRNNCFSTGLKRIPPVWGCLPVFGHVLQFAFFGELNFLRRCHKKYGGIFKIKLFRKNIVVACDHHLVPAFFKEKEEYLSHSAAIAPFGIVFPGGEFGYDVPTALGYMRKALAFNKEEVIARVEEETQGLVDRLQHRWTENNSNNNLDLKDELYRHITRISYSSFCPTKLSETLITELHGFFDQVSQVLRWTYLLPNWLVPWICKLGLSRSRSSLVKIFEEHVRTYQSGAGTVESILIDHAIEYGDKVGGSPSNVTKYAAGFIIGFIYSTVGNTTAALVNTIQYLAMPENCRILADLREECQRSVSVQTDFRQLLTAPLLNACIMETARSSANFIGTPRVPKAGLQNLGGYFVEESVDLIALCGPILQVFGNTESYFKNPTKFWPYRFVEGPMTGPAAEPTSSHYIINWAGGLHACPGKNFALYAIKICVAHFILNFDFEIEGSVPEEFKYVAPIAFGQRDVKVVLKKKEE